MTKKLETKKEVSRETKKEVKTILDGKVTVINQDEKSFEGEYIASDKSIHELSVEKVSLLQAMKLLSLRYYHDLTDVDTEDEVQSVYIEFECQSQINEIEKIINLERKKKALADFQEKLTFPTNSYAVAAACVKRYVIDGKPMPSKKGDMVKDVLPTANILKGLDGSPGKEFMKAQGSSDLNAKGAINCIQVLKALGLI